MANPDHLKILARGIDAWNAWRMEEPSVEPELSGVVLADADLPYVDFSGTALFNAKLAGANLIRANLSGATLNGADLTEADLTQADLSEASLSRAILASANLDGANLRKARLGEANLNTAYIVRADLTEARLIGANLSYANLTDANLSSCRIFGISAWKLKLEGAHQENLVITPPGEPEVTTDNLEVAQFIYLLLHNEKIRDVIGTIGRKAVLILGRFTPERKAVLDSLREELRKRDYLPILFDFEKPVSQDLTATVSTLAHLAQFIIADLTDPSSIPYELATVAPVPIQPILQSGKPEFAMFVDLRRRYGWVLPTQPYEDLKQLIADFNDRVIRPAEAKVAKLRT